MPTHRSDAQDPQAWVHHDDLTAYARRLLGTDPAGAEDVVQEAYLRLAECEAEGRAPTEPRPWLFRVVRNLALDERRRRQRAVPTAVPHDQLPGSPPPAEIVAQRKRAEDALREVASLPPRERRAVLMDQAGAAPRRIARELKTTPNSVHQALFRARRRLRAAPAAAWGMLPAPLARVLIRVIDSPAPQLLASAGTGDGRTLRLAGLVGASVVLIAGGGSAIKDGLPNRPDKPPRVASVASTDGTSGGLIAVSARSSSLSGAQSSAARSAGGSGNSGHIQVSHVRQRTVHRESEPGDDGGHRTVAGTRSEGLDDREGHSETHGTRVAPTESRSSEGGEHELERERSKESSSETSTKHSEPAEKVESESHASTESSGGEHSTTSSESSSESSNSEVKVEKPEGD